MTTQFGVRLYNLLVLFTELNKKGTEGFSAGLIDDEDLFKWEVTIFGPPDTF